MTRAEGDPVENAGEEQGRMHNRIEASELGNATNALVDITERAKTRKRMLTEDGKRMPDQEARTGVMSG